MEKDGRVKGVFLYGESMGGMASVLAASEAGERILGLGLLYPALCIPENWLKEFPRVEDIPETLSFWDLTLGRCFFTEMRELRVFELLPGLRVPVLLMHGEEDPTVPIAFSLRARDLLKDVTFEAFPGEGHGFTDAGVARVCALLTDFVRRHSD